MFNRNVPTPIFLLLFATMVTLVFSEKVGAQARFASFLISQSQNMSGAVECPFLNFQNWDGSIWTAWVKGDKIVATPNGNVFQDPPTRAINYIDPDGNQISAKLEGGKLVHFANGDSREFSTGESISFKSWDGRPLYAKILSSFPQISVPVNSASESYHVGPRFTSQNDEITDWQTNLIWKLGADKDTDFDESQNWINSLGSGWRRPTQRELKSLFSRGEGGGMKGNMPSVFPKMGGTVVWAEESDSKTSWYVGFMYGNVYTLGKDKSRFARAMAVRQR